MLRVRFQPLIFVAIIWPLLTVPAWADAGDDQYTVAAAHYSQQHWALAVQEFELFLKDFSDHPRAAKATFFLAEAQVQLGHYAEAQQRFTEFMQRDPHSPFARQAAFRAGEAAFFAGRTSDAKQLLERFAADFPGDKLNSYVLAYLGDMALAAGDAAAAQSYYERGRDKFATGPMRDDCALGVARALSVQGKREPAAAQFAELAVKKDCPVAPDAAYAFGLLQAGAGDHAQAAITLDRFETDFPDNRWANKARLAQAQSLYQLKDYERAAALLKPLLSQPEVANEARFWLGMTQKAQHDWEGASKTLTDKTDKDAPAAPLAESMRSQAADALLHAGDYAGAVKLLEQTQVGDETGARDRDPLQQLTNRYLLAVAYQGSKRHADALHVLDGLDPPENSSLRGSILAARATSLVALGQFDKAIAPLEAVTASHSGELDLARPWAELAICYARSGQWDKAQAALDALHALKPSEALSAPTELNIAQTAYAAGQPALAAKLFAGVSEASAAEYAAPGLSGLAACQFAAGNFDTALQTLDRLLDKFPAAPQVPEGTLLRGQTLEQLNKLDGALAMYHQVVEKYATTPQAAPALLAAARLHEQLQQYPESTALYQKFVREHADSPDLDAALYGWGWALRGAGQSAAASEQFQRLRSQFPTSRYWADATYRLAEMDAETKNLAEAQSLIDELLTSKSAGDLAPHALYLKGQLAVQAEHWNQVPAPLVQLVHDYPASGLRLAAEFWIAEAAYRQGQYDEADRQFEALASRAEGQQEPWLAMIPLRRAQVLAQQRRWEESQDLAAKIATNFPNFAQQFEVDYLLGRCFASQADFEKARQAYGKVVRSTTGGKTETAAMAQWMIGESYFHQRNYEAAAREYLRVEILYAYPHWQAGALLQAGKCYEALTQWKAATDVYARLLKMYPNTDFTEEATRHLQIAQKHVTDKGTK